jgi:hypothetical protein
MVRLDRPLDQLAERAVDAVDEASRHAGYRPLPPVVVGCGGGCEVVVAFVVVDDEYVGT